ncbi:MAG: hypothetical protein SGJ18_02425 [Pseudomonadota bacterium]|nr:hypothetical protein [Pseudomonadota bacterium]
MKVSKIILFCLVTLLLPTLIYQNCNERPLDLSGLSGSSSLTEKTRITGGHLHSCLLNAGNLKCWGFNQWGEVGNGNIVSQSSPVTALDKDVTYAAAGTHYTCAIKVGGALFCWGQNSFGQLGNGTTVASTAPPTFIPQPVIEMSAGVTKVTAGYFATCAIKERKLYCWGNNSDGQLGIGNTTNQNYPVAVPGMESDVTDVATTGYQGNHTCAIKAGALYCWGVNRFYQLGDGTAVARKQPVPVNNMNSGVTSVAVGAEYTCAIKQSKLYCWGLNNNGRLGTGDLIDRVVPTQISFEGKLVQKISVASTHACALAGGQAYCWGGNTFGQIGNETYVDVSTPFKLVGLDNASDVTASGTYDSVGSRASSYAIVGNKVYSWGANSYGQLGNGSTTSRTVVFEAFTF